MKVCILFLIFLFSFSSSANVEQDIRAADYISERADAVVKIKDDGTYVLSGTQSFRVQNEKGRTELGLREIPYTSKDMEVRVLEAYTMNGMQKTPTNLKKITTRSESTTGTIAISDTRKVIIPFNNVKVGSLIVYRYEMKIKPQIPGVFTMSMIFGKDEPEISGKIDFYSPKILKFLILDKNKYFKFITNEEKTKGYKYTISWDKPIYLARELSRKLLIESLDIASIMISSATSWSTIAAAIAPKYEEITNQNLPPQFQKILSAANLLKTDIEKINYVSMEVSKIIAYSGDWTTPQRRFFPKGHAEVVREAKGDCKDFSSSVAGILRKMGYDASVALVLSANPASRVFKDIELQKLVPTGEIFNHAITHIKMKDGRVFWIDPTRPVEYAGGVWAENEDSPALILRSQTTNLERITWNPSMLGSLKIEKIVKGLSAQKAEWKGNLSMEKSSALEFIQQFKIHGQTKMEMAIPKYILGIFAFQNSNLPLEKKAFASSKAQVDFNFNLIGKNPLYEEKERTILNLGTDIGLLRFFGNNDSNTGNYYGAKTNQVMKTTYINVQVDDPIDGDCLVMSPWLDYERKVEIQENNTVVTEKSLSKKSFITYAETFDKNYGYFLDSLRTCVNNHDLNVRKTLPTKKPIAIDDISVMKNLPLTAESFPEVEKIFSKLLPPEKYIYLKAKRIAEKALDKNPKNVSALRIRARSVYRLGYIGADEYKVDHIQYALNEMEKAIQFEPKNVEARFFRSFVFTNQGKYDDALKDLTAAYYADPKNFKVLTQMALVYAQKNDKKTADAWLIAAKQLATNKDLEIGYWGVAARIAKLQKDFKKNIEATEKLTILEPTQWTMHNYAIALSDDEQFDKSIEICRKTIAKFDYGPTKHLLGTSLSKKVQKIMQKKSPKEFTTDRNIENLLIESLKYRDDNEQVYMNLAQIYVHRVTYENMPDWLDNADMYIEDGMKQFPTSQLIALMRDESHRMKKMLYNNFKAKGQKLTGRWPASFEKSQ